MKRQLVLFDIDHTLVDLLPFHEPAYRIALREVCGIDGALRTIQFSGKTTPNILRELCCQAGLKHAVVEDRLPRVLARLSTVMLTQLDCDLRPYILPGVADLLRCLAGRGHVLGVVTGNLPEIGTTVLDRTGLLDYFAVCAFGTEAVDRADLVMLAIERARKRCGDAFAPAGVTVVGDSPHDIAAGKQVGTRTVAIATGLSSRAELAAAAPDFLVCNCRDYQRLCQIITNGNDAGRQGPGGR